MPAHIIDGPEDAVETRPGNRLVLAKALDDADFCVRDALEAAGHRV